MKGTLSSFSIFSLTLFLVINFSCDELIPKSTPVKPSNFDTEHISFESSYLTEYRSMGNFQGYRHFVKINNFYQNDYYLYSTIINNAKLYVDTVRLNKPVMEIFYVSSTLGFHRDNELVDWGQILNNTILGVRFSQNAGTAVIDAIYIYEKGTPKVIRIKDLILID